MPLHAHSGPAHRAPEHPDEYPDGDVERSPGALPGRAWLPRVPRRGHLRLDRRSTASAGADRKESAQAAARNSPVPEGAWRRAARAGRARSQPRAACGAVGRQVAEEVVVAVAPLPPGAREDAALRAAETPTAPCLAAAPVGGWGVPPKEDESERPFRVWADSLPLEAAPPAELRPAPAPRWRAALWAPGNLPPALPRLSLARRGRLPSRCPTPIRAPDRAHRIRTAGAA